jgi:starch-binding outer membrane protein, SusD/RagB family
MKRKILSVIIVLATISLVVTFTSCKKENFLDVVNDNDLNLRTTFVDSIRTMEFLNGIYSGLTFMANPKQVGEPNGGIQMDAATDESEIKWLRDNVAPALLSQSVYGPNLKTFTVDANWTFLYTKIRAVNIYLANVDKSPIDAAVKTRTKAEARFLRAWFYHFLVKLYGGVPLAGDVVKDKDAVSDILRSSFEDCLNYIVAECDAVANELPVSYAANIDYGRITKGAALALKARMLLMAASPLFNGGSEATSADLVKLTAYPTADAARWQRAFTAIEDVINLNQYSLNQASGSTRPGIGYYQLFLKRVNSEYILPFMMPDNKVMEGFCLPYSRNPGGAGAWNTLSYPTQELVDAYPMRNGKGITEAGSGYNVNNPYINRDPRFYFSIIFNGVRYLDRVTNTQTQVFTYKDAPIDGAVDNWSGTNNRTKTGYYFRKMCDSTLTAFSTANSQFCFPLIRYADVLLQYAEAANETNRPAIAIAQLRAIRQRAGIDAGTDGNYGLPVSPTQAQLRRIIQDERFIELALEQQRFFDIRRWKTPADPSYNNRFNKPMTGILWSNAAGTSFTLRPLSSRLFTKGAYFLPIPDGEINNNFGILQNPGW